MNDPLRETTNSFSRSGERTDALWYVMQCFGHKCKSQGRESPGGVADIKHAVWTGWYCASARVGCGGHAVGSCVHGGGEGGTHHG